jgi:hypothetical protein
MQFVRVYETITFTKDNGFINLKKLKQLNTSSGSLKPSPASKVFLIRDTGVKSFRDDGLKMTQ